MCDELREGEIESLPLPKDWAESVRHAVLNVVGIVRRPHDTLGDRTPNEVYFSRPAAHEQPRLEPRELWPRGSPRAAPQVDIDGEPGDPIILEIGCLEGRRHLPIIRTHRAA